MPLPPSAGTQLSTLFEAEVCFDAYPAMGLDEIGRSTVGLGKGDMPMSGNGEAPEPRGGWRCGVAGEAMCGCAWECMAGDRGRLESLAEAAAAAAAARSPALTAKPLLVLLSLLAEPCATPRLADPMNLDCLCARASGGRASGRCSRYMAWGGTERVREMRCETAETSAGDAGCMEAARCERERSEDCGGGWSEEEGRRRFAMDAERRLWVVSSPPEPPEAIAAIARWGEAEGSEVRGGEGGGGIVKWGALEGWELYAHRAERGLNVMRGERVWEVRWPGRVVRSRCRHDEARGGHNGHGGSECDTVGGGRWRRLKWACGGRQGSKGWSTVSTAGSRGNGSKMRFERLRRLVERCDQMTKAELWPFRKLDFRARIGEKDTCCNAVCTWCGDGTYGMRESRYI